MVNNLLEEATTIGKERSANSFGNKLMKKQVCCSSLLLHFNIVLDIYCKSVINLCKLLFYFVEEKKGNQIDFNRNTIFSIRLEFELRDQIYSAKMI